MSSMALTFHPKSLQNKANVYVRTLTISDLDRCLELEKKCFPENEACSREKLIYRLTVCPELCVGLMTLTKPHPDTPKGASDFKPQEILLAHIISTKTVAKTVTDAAMRIPKHLLARFDPQAAGGSTEGSKPEEKKDEAVKTATEGEDKAAAQADAQPNPPSSTPADELEGHCEAGQTIALHSMCVSPDHRKNGFATILLKDYISRMRDAGVSTRISLLSHSDVIPFYTKNNFKDLGDSKCQYGGGNWRDCILELEGSGGRLAALRGR